MTVFQVFWVVFIIDRTFTFGNLKKFPESGAPNYAFDDDLSRAKRCDLHTGKCDEPKCTGGKAPVCQCVNVQLHLMCLECI